LEKRKAYLYALPRSNAKRMGVSIREVEVSVGRKYLTDTFGHKFYKDLSLGEYAIPCHEQYEPEYSGEFVLFNAREDAEARQKGDCLVDQYHKVRSKMEMKLRDCPVSIIETFVAFSTAIASGDLNSVRENVQAHRCDVIFSVYDECDSGDRKIDSLLLKYGAKTHEEALAFIKESNLNAEAMFEDWCYDHELDPKQCPYYGAIEIEEFFDQESSLSVIDVFH